MSDKIEGNLLKDQVYERLAKMISNAELMPGDRLTEAQIAEKFGVSFTPVREALIKLNSDGIIHKIPHKGFYINKYNDKEINEIYQVFVNIQELAIQLIINKLTESDFLEQESIINDMEKACNSNDYKSYLFSNHKIHDYYIYKADNKFLTSIYKKISIMPMPIFYFVAEGDKCIENMQKNISEHRLIVKLIKEKDLDGIRKALINHYGVTYD
ncbi:GntR family transcriptional regulator [Anaerotignum faecicola]|nr:GntR family transcriptional regulator [Anaerotignum faecicola]